MTKPKRKTTKTGSAIAVQLALNLEEDYKPTKLQMQPSDIGGALASTLSEGLYTNPMHAIREYIQNAVDSGAKKVTIKLTANSVSITDNGSGMDLNELVHARKFGISSKDFAQNVGFRGIGLYSGLDLCNKLIITTQKRQQDKRYVLTFDFAGMKLQILKEQLDKSVAPTSLLDLITNYSTFSQEPGNSTQHWTSVVLEDVKPFHLEQLYNTDQLRDYILKTLPIDFDDKFDHRTSINEELQRLPGYRAAHVVIEADGKDDILVAKPAIPRLRSPKTGFIKGAKQENIAFYWACMNKDRGKISDDFANFRGFTYKVKGFTIGDNRRLQSYFSSRGSQGLYWWWTGEIYIIDPDVVPNAERDDFQSSPAKNVLVTQVETLLGSLEDDAAKFQKEGRALEELDRIDTEVVGAISASVRNREAKDSAIQFHELEQAKKILKKQKSNLPADKKVEAEKVLVRLERLQAEIRKGMVEEATPSPKPRQAATRKKSSTTDDEAATQPEPSKPTFSRTLVQVVEESGWEISDEGWRLLEVLDNALSDVLIVGSQTYVNFLTHLEELLADSNT